MTVDVSEAPEAMIRDVASERTGDAAPPGNLPAPPRNFYANSSLLLIYYLPRTANCNSCLCTEKLNFEFYIYNNNANTIFSWLKRCVPPWTPCEDFVHLPECFLATSLHDIDLVIWYGPSHLRIYSSFSMKRVKFITSKYETKVFLSLHSYLILSDVLIPGRTKLQTRKKK